MLDRLDDHFLLRSQVPVELRHYDVGMHLREDAQRRRASVGHREGKTPGVVKEDVFEFRLVLEDEPFDTWTLLFHVTAHKRCWIGEPACDVFVLGEGYEGDARLGREQPANDGIRFNEHASIDWTKRWRVLALKEPDDV